MIADRLGRVCLLIGLVVSGMSLVRALSLPGMPYAPMGLDRLPLGPPVAAGFVLLTVAASVLFVLGRRPRPAAFTIALVFALGAQAAAWQVPDGLGANGAVALPGASLVAWWIADLLPAYSALHRRVRATDAACGVVAASYLLAAASKIWMSGFEWASAGNIAMQIATQAAMVTGPLHALRMTAVELPVLCGALGAATLLIEGGAILFVVPAARVPLAVLIAGMHMGISILMGLHHYDWMFTVLGWALLGRPAARGVVASVR